VYFLILCSNLLKVWNVAPSLGIGKVGRWTNAIDRSLHVHIPDVGSPPKDANSYSVAEDLVDWLTNTRELTIHGGFEDDSRIGDEPEGSTPPGDERTWSLIRRMAANFKNLEYLELSRESWGLYLPDVFECVKFPRLKSLRLHGISEAKHKVVELAPEVFHIS
jgi:hypothetical protein